MKIKLNIRLLSLLAVMGIFASCSKDDDTTPIGEENSHEPIILDCNMFTTGEEIVLTDDPLAPIDYIVECDPKVKGDLIIEAGVVIAFERNAGLNIIHDNNYKVQMNGTADKPIILTGVEKERGYWKGIQLATDNPANSMSYVTVEYTGQKRSGGWGYIGAVIGAWDAVLKMDHCTISYSKEMGLNWNGNAGELLVSNSTFTKNDIPIVTSPNHINSLDGSSTYSGNDNDYIQLKAQDVYHDITFHKTDVPFFSDGIKPSNSGKRKFVFKPGATLLMEAGSEIKFDNAFHYEHETIMEGTADDRITIKGMEDVPGYWKGIIVNSSSPLNRIWYTDIANAGETTGYPNGAIKVGSSAVLDLNDVNFINCFEYAVSLDYYPGHTFVFSYNNLNLVNTPKLFSDFSGNEVVNP